MLLGLDGHEDVDARYQGGDGVSGASHKDKLLPLAWKLVTVASAKGSSTVQPPDTISISRGWHPRAFANLRSVLG